MADMKDALNAQRSGVNDSSVYPGFWVSRITRPVPLLEGQPVYVVIPDIDNNIKWGPCRWTPHPSAGAKDVLDIKQLTSDFVMTSTTEATAQPILISNPITFDGSTPILVEFWAAATNNGSGFRILHWNVFDNGVNLGICGIVVTPTSSTDVNRLYFPFRYTPSAGVHTISSCIWGGLTNTIKAGNGGAGQYAPAIQRIVPENISKSSYPKLGDTALIVFDNRGSPWVVSYGS